MRVRLVALRRRRSGPPAERVELLDADVLGIGRGTDNAIVLPGLTVALRHAEIRLQGGQVWVEPIGAAELRVNRQRAREGRRLAPGDVLQIAVHELRVTPPEPGDALRLEIELGAEPAEAREELARRARVADEPRWLGRRAASWLLALGIPALFVGVPLASGRLESAWNSGPLSRPHSFIAEDCQRCHEGEFRRVRDEACLDCHAQVGHHVAELQGRRPRSEAEPSEAGARRASRRPRSEPQASEVHPAFAAALDGVRCADCHAEHEGASGLARVEQRQCAECHAALQARFPDSATPDVSDFGAEHPEFSAALATGLPTRRTREATLAPGLEDLSGLRFSHRVHVGGGVQDLASGERRFLPCGDCHEPEAGGAAFAPVRFETHCRSCHALTYDADHPERQAPHGDPVALREMLVAFYRGEALRGGVADPHAPAALRRRAPGRALGEDERRAALAWADARAREAERDLLEEPGECARCHEIEPGAAADGGDAIAPVHVVQPWLRASRFRHDRHEPSACRHCHPAAAVFAPDPPFAGERPAWSLAGPGHAAALFTPDELRAEHALAPSEHASDVLLPSIETCRGCHGGARAEPPRVASDCVLCHAFHHEELGPLRGAGGPAGEQAR